MYNYDDRARDAMKIELSDEELQAVIDFNEAMASDAYDSCEYEEAKQRRCRARSLRALARRTT